MSLVCPYCGKEIPAPDDKRDPGVDYEQECPECGRWFSFEVEYTPSYSAKRADCLNGADHDFQPTKTFPEEFSRICCTMCGGEKPSTTFSEGQDVEIVVASNPAYHDVGSIVTLTFVDEDARQVKCLDGSGGAVTYAFSDVKAWYAHEARS